MMPLWVFRQVRAHLPCEEESGRRFSHSFLYKMLSFRVFATAEEHVLLVSSVLRDLLMRPLWATEWEEKHTGVGRKHDALHHLASGMEAWLSRVLCGVEVISVEE